MKTSGVLFALLGLITGLLIASAYFLRLGSSQVHRVSVNYPSKWSTGEYRNCRLARPHYKGDLWPEFDCDGSGSINDAVQGTHAFVMDVRFLGEYIVPTDVRRLTWTCQLSTSNELICRDLR